jgi:hypothetical protein
VSRSPEAEEKTMKRSYVLTGLAVIVAIAIASPAIGGPSLKKLVKKQVKKEVAKQIGKATGPAGPPGAPGAPGAPGSALEGSATADSGDPLATILEVGGFRFRLNCVPLTSVIELVNVSGGANSHFKRFTGSGATQNDSFNQGQAVSIVAQNLASSIDSVVFSIVGSNGALLNGQAAVVNSPASGFGGADCVGFVTVV